MMESPISLNTEEIVKKEMIKAIALMTNKKLIKEEKNDKKNILLD